MFKAYKKYWMGYFDFTGRSSRSDYWLVVLANTIVTIILFSILIVVIVFDSPDSPYHVILTLLYLLVMTYFPASFIPSIALQVRRLRDAGYHWALIFLRFAFVIGGIVLLILFCQPTKVEYPFNNFNNPQQ
ncbi:DUF805 domain-containing protein [Streptococcus salivarius]|jgi:uncharacterized membrane protein YhaH (DUF805 family)|uniref:DUF805 domain-containing protein n=1 Tax=Streptococcus salivarius TaxID=1304 RepID=A0A413AEQ8_STRSL|nr:MULTISPECIES: DUF805 domain-containing protein [Streptococcus]MBS5746249.1 DUF805 domain-containing protein [Streptococcus sp.]ETS89080.1 PF05656 family protein [Streptococcus sp. SR4]MTR02903.1 DUF805 domain-containing protein [Streptococcus salivarius]MTR51431.1 DUF805 domain-containing protein [Streptococcus salivarius]QMI51623.1 DUF805 domain-containing protein [Streptococcus salivarius]